MTTIESPANGTSPVNKTKPTQRLKLYQKTASRFKNPTDAAGNPKKPIKRILLERVASVPSIVSSPNAALAPQATFTFADFVDKAQIQGLKDWYSASSKTSSCAYLAIVVLFSAITILQVAYLVKDFQENPILTSIDYDIRENARYPKYIQLCLADFVDPRRVIHYMLETISLHEEYSSLKTEDIAARLFPQADNETLDSLLVNGSRFEDLDFLELTKLLTNGKVVLTSFEEVGSILRFYAQLLYFNWYDADQISWLFTFNVEMPIYIIGSLRQLLKHRHQLEGKNTHEATMEDLNNLGVQLSHKFDVTPTCSHEVEPSLSIERGGNSCGFEFESEMQRVLDTHNAAGLCHIVAVIDNRPFNSLTDRIVIHMSLENADSPAAAQYKSDKVIVRFGDELRVVDDAFVSFGAITQISFETSIWDRTEMGDCVERNEDKFQTLELLGTTIPYTPSVCRFSPFYWESQAEDATDGSTPCDCLVDFGSYMIGNKNPWAELKPCDSEDALVGLCDGARCSSVAEQESCEAFDNCTYTAPRCLAEKTRAVKNLTQLERQRTQCKPFCVEAEYALKTTVLHQVKLWDLQLLHNTLKNYQFINDYYFEDEWIDYTKHLRDAELGMKQGRARASEKIIRNMMAEDPYFFTEGVSDFAANPLPSTYLTLFVRSAKRFNVRITQTHALTLERLASDIGGTFGLWLGASIYSVVQLVLMLMNGVYTKHQRRKTKVRPEIHTQLSTIPE